ncbi:transcriptional regulator, LuxR family with TPR repeats [Desulfosarcina variabilis str. Montpellier]|uniref:LuxR C-terminal-related transcriptional regulator n=1 Tax=Desulfosarcina variabilis TaxID=2300 RepID=UPI003AFB5E0C
MQGHKDISAFIKTFAGDERHIVDYLAEEVLNLQPAHVQDFLLQTSILNRLSGSLCDFLTGQKGSQKILDDLERANLFILPLDNKRCWYRYHHLFADLLRQRLNQAHRVRIHDLHTRASEWYERNEFSEEAIEHALMAKDFKRAVRLVLGLAEVMWKRAKPARLFRWLKALPDEYVLSSPTLCIIYAWILCDNGQYQAAERLLQTAERILDSINTGNTANPQIESKSQPSLTVRDLQGRIAAVRAYMATGQGDVQRIVNFSEKALQFLHQNDATWRAGVAMSLGMAHTIKGDNGSAVKALSEAVSASKTAGNGSLYLIANIWLAVRLKDYGQLPRAIDICKHLFGVLAEEKLTNTAAEGGLISIWGEVLYELNELDEALRYEKKGLLLLEQGHHVGARGWAYLCLLKILTAKKDFSGIEELIREIEKLEQTSDVPPWITPWTEAWKARIWLMRGNLDRAVSWAEERGLKLDDDLNPLREPEYIMFARILIADGQLNDAMELLERLSKAEEKDGRILRQIETLILKEQKNINESLITLGTALSLAESGGYIRIFLNEGPPIAQLLEKILDGKADVSRAYVKKLLSAFRAEKIIEAEEGLAENLSDRELEVLRLIAAGLSNKKITEALFVSLSTVKTHLRNIYAKLNVHSRTEAIVKAKTLELL